MSLERSERWFTAVWPFVRSHLPPPPARVVELGCGTYGGLVPRLLDAGYEAVGVDPEAPDGHAYRREEFEYADFDGDLDALVACTSLHHVADPALVFDRVSELLRPGGALAVVEWDWQRIDEPTGTWCFERLSSDGEETWLHGLRDQSAALGGEWAAFLAQWARTEGVHAWRTLESLLDARFERRHIASGPYFFAALEGTSAEDEQAAIDAGELAATRVDYAAVAGGR
jgi:SAM-dependent methyltransferase